jgi:hypothetical protein
VGNGGNTKNDKRARQVLHADAVAALQPIRLAEFTPSTPVFKFRTRTGSAMISPPPVSRIAMHKGAWLISMR